MKYKILNWFGLILLLSLAGAQSDENINFTICRLKYGGGGDWYSNPSSLPNLLTFIRENTNVVVSANEGRASLDEEDLFSHKFLYMTGHGNVRFSDKEIINLRAFLMGGGFLHADDNYGMDKSFRREMKRLFPNKDWVELPHDHTIYNINYKFPNGLPKIHEHDGKSPQGLGLYHNNRLIVFYTYESDLGDGWEDIEVHNDPMDKHLDALKMGTNIFLFALFQ